MATTCLCMCAIMTCWTYNLCDYFIIISCARTVRDSRLHIIYSINGGAQFDADVGLQISKCHRVVVCLCSSMLRTQTQLVGHKLTSTFVNIIRLFFSYACNAVCLFADDCGIFIQCSSERLVSGYNIHIRSVFHRICLHVFERGWSMVNRVKHYAVAIDESLVRFHFFSRTVRNDAYVLYCKQIGARYGDVRCGAIIGFMLHITYIQYRILFSRVHKSSTLWCSTCKPIWSRRVRRDAKTTNCALEQKWCRLWWTIIFFMEWSDEKKNDTRGIQQQKVMILL